MTWGWGSLIRAVIATGVISAIGCASGATSRDRITSAAAGTKSPSLDERCPPLSASLGRAALVRGQQNLGFVVHAYEAGRDAYASSGSPSMLLNLFAWRMRDIDKQLVDFVPAEEWLRFLYQTGLQAAVIIDTSIHHTSIPWRSQATRSLGQNVCAQNGKQTEFSSPYSPRYREMVTQYIRDITGWVAANDTEHRVTTYVNGAEVFWPGIIDSGPMAYDPFRKWLLERYGSLATINTRWGGEYKSIQEIKPPLFYGFGNMVYGPNTFVSSDFNDEAWSTPLGPAHHGQRYRVSVEVSSEKVLNDLVAAQITFTAAGHAPDIAVAATTGTTRARWSCMEGTVQVPDWAEQGRLDLVLKGPGKVMWRSPRVSREMIDENLVGNPGLGVPSNAVGTTLPQEWQISRWHGNGAAAVVRSVGDGAALTLEAPQPEYSLKRPGAAWYDFVTFSMETYAETMNHWARTIKSCDPTRLVMHYCGYLLGTLSEWDLLTLTQRPDIFLSSAPDVDVNGLQLCSGKGDFHYATVVLDLARKYGKPMVATDLQDFTHGVYVGFNSLNRTSLACIAHGMSGAYYYNWYGTPDYSWFRSWPPEDTARMIGNASRLITFLEGSTLETSTGFLLPIQPYCEADPGGQKADMLDAMGWYKLIVQTGQCPDVFTPYELMRPGTDTLSRHRILFVPDCPILPATAADRLWKYVESGGQIVFGGRPPCVDETSMPLPRPFLPPGVKPAEDTQDRVVRAVVADVSASLTALPVGTQLAGQAVLLDSGGIWPGVVERPHGSGRITWTGGMDGRGYLGPVKRYSVAGNTPPLFLPDGNWTWPRTEGMPLLAMVRGLIPESAMSVRLDPPDPRVEVCIHRKDGELRVVLIHTSPGMHTTGTLVLSGEPARVPEILADFDPRPAKVIRRDGGNRCVQLPDFADCCTIRW